MVLQTLKMSTQGPPYLRLQGQLGSQRSRIHTVGPIPVLDRLEKFKDFPKGSASPLDIRHTQPRRARCQ